MVSQEDTGSVRKTKYSSTLEPYQSLRKEFVSLSIKTILVVAGVLIFLYLFNAFGPNLFGIKQYHIQVVDSVVTVSIAFAVIKTRSG